MTFDPTCEYGEFAVFNGYDPWAVLCFSDAYDPVLAVEAIRFLRSHIRTFIPGQYRSRVKWIKKVKGTVTCLAWKYTNDRRTHS
jgi:hypothetical protein